MTDLEKVALLRAKWAVYPGFVDGGFKDCLDTIELLWKVTNAAHSFREQLRCYSQGVSALTEEDMKVIDTRLLLALRAVGL